MNKIQVLNLDFVYNIQLALRLWLVLMQNWGRDFDWFWCKIGLGGWDFYAKLGRGLIVRLVNKVEVSSSGRTLAQICFFSRYLYSFKLSVFVYVCICVFVFFSRCAANKCEMVLWKMQNTKQYSGINAYFFCSFCAISETKRSLRDPLVSK